MSLSNLLNPSAEQENWLNIYANQVHAELLDVHEVDVDDLKVTDGEFQNLSVDTSFSLGVGLGTYSMPVVKGSEGQYLSIKNGVYNWQDNPESEVIFRQGAVSDGNVYGSWAEIADLIVAKDGLLDVYIDDSIVSPCVVSSNVNCNNLTNFHGKNNASALPKLEISGGFALTNPKSFNTLELQLSSPVLPNLVFTAGSIFLAVNGASLKSIDSTVPNISFPDGDSMILSLGLGGNIDNSGNIMLRLGVGSGLIVTVLENAGNLVINNVIDSVDASSSIILGYDSSFDPINFVNPGFLGTLTLNPISVSAAVKYDDSTLPSYGSDNVQGVLDKIKSVLTFGPSKLVSALPLVVPSAQDVANPDISWADSANTGLYSSSTGKVNIACEGLNSFQISKNGVSGSAEVLLNDGFPQQIPFSKIEALAPSGPCIVDFFSNGSQSNVIVARANGTASAPTKVLNGNSLGNLRCQGWTDAGSLGSTSASVQFKASEDFNSATNVGGRIEFYTVPNGTATLTQRMTLENNGRLGINQAAPAAILDVNGASGLTLKITDTNQGAGKVLTSDASGVASWSAVDSLSRSAGFIYYEPAVGASTGFAFGVMGTQYLLNPATTLASSTNFDMPANGRLRYTGSVTRVFKCEISLSFANNSGVTSQQIYFWPRKNGSAITGASTTEVTGVLTTDFHEASMSFLVSLAQNDYVELYSSDESSTTGIDVHSIQIVCS